MNLNGAWREEYVVFGMNLRLLRKKNVIIWFRNAVRTAPDYKTAVALQRMTGEFTGTRPNMCRNELTDSQDKILMLMM